MTLTELVDFEKDWLDEAGYTKENVIIALCAIKAKTREQDSCDECRAELHGSDEFFNFDSPMVKGESENED